jgi:hypothetical protein
MGIDFSNSDNFPIPCVSTTKKSPKLGSRMFGGKIGKLGQVGWSLFRMLWSAFGVSIKIELYDREQKETWELADKYLPETCMIIGTSRGHDCVKCTIWEGDCLD